MMDFTIETDRNIVRRVRQMPAVFFQSQDRQGALCALKRMVENFVRDVRVNGGDLVTLRCLPDGSFEIENNGPGLPMDNWQEIFTEIPVAPRGQQDSDDPWDLYVCAVQCVSQYMDVTVWQAGQEYRLRFEKGENVGGLFAVPAPNTATGTRIRFHLDGEIFTDIQLDAEECRNVLEGFARGGHGIGFALECAENQE